MVGCTARSPPLSPMQSGSRSTTASASISSLTCNYRSFNMPDYDNTNRGALFRNDDKRSEKQPDYTGPLDVSGESFWISGWLNTSKKGVKYLSLAIKPNNSEAARPKKSRADDLDDEI